MDNKHHAVACAALCSEKYIKNEKKAVQDVEESTLAVWTDLPTTPYCLLTLFPIYHLLVFTGCWQRVCWRVGIQHIVLDPAEDFGVTPVQKGWYGMT